ncbi:MAG TPA: trypsin-like peptidase domain-containing protein [Gemmataceae bacterium]|nr:trypsin-like peptidase domain-containing protein [Gemmataceae bacterium]
MMTPRRKALPGPCGPRFVLALLLSLAFLTPARADSRALALERAVPAGAKDLRAIQDQVKRVAAKALPCTVCVRIGNAFGSGVIVSKDGYVLTAGHISGEPNRDVRVILSDGRTVAGKTLGSDVGIDSGMVRITDEGVWPFVEMGNASKLKKGQWCVALGHPNGYKHGRPPVLRLGRVLENKSRIIRTGCALVGGDSGGPLFDLDGKVIGIHSRIGTSLTYNIHVPVDTYRTTWDRLVKSEVWGGPSGPYIGVVLNPGEKECKIAEVEKNSPAEKAGLRPDDVVIRFDKKKIAAFEDLITLIHKHKPGDTVPLEVRRGKEVLNLKVIVGKRAA